MASRFLQRSRGALVSVRASVALVALAALAACSKASPTQVASSSSSSSSSASSSSSSSSHAETPHVIVISIDGLRPESYLRADALGLRIPALRALMQRGRYAEGMTSIFPTVTFPAHTTMVTGVRPARHGITANVPFDPWDVNHGGWNWYAESIKTETLWTAAHDAGLTTGAIFWPVTVGAPIDFNVPQVWREKVDEDLKLVRALSSPGFPKELEAQDVPLPAENRSDKERGDAAEYLIREKKPALALLYFGDLDGAEHGYGPGTPEAFATLERIDAQVARVIAATQAAGTYQSTTVFVVSDHGFQAVATEARPAVWLADAGLLTLDAQKHITDWQAAALVAGGLSGIVLRRRDDAALAGRVGAALTTLAADPANGIRKVYKKTEIEANGGFPDASFALEAAAGFEMVSGVDAPAVRPSAHKGTHGYPPSDPDMRASFMVAGPGIAKGAPLPNVDMIDLAPTVAKILHLSLPHAEGHAIDTLF